MTFQDFFNDLFKFSMTLGLAVMFENFQNSPCFSIFFDLKQLITETNSVIHQNACLFNYYSSLSYIILLYHLQ